MSKVISRVLSHMFSSVMRSERCTNVLMTAGSCPGWSHGIQIKFDACGFLYSVWPKRTSFSSIIRTSRKCRQLFLSTSMMYCMFGYLVLRCLKKCPSPVFYVARWWRCRLGIFQAVFRSEDLSASFSKNTFAFIKRYVTIGDRGKLPLRQKELPLCVGNCLL